MITLENPDLNKQVYHRSAKLIQNFSDAYVTNHGWHQRAVNFAKYLQPVVIIFCEITLRKSFCETVFYISVHSENGNKTETSQKINFIWNGNYLSRTQKTIKIF